MPHAGRPGRSLTCARGAAPIRCGTRLPSPPGTRRMVDGRPFMETTVDTDHSTGTHPDHRPASAPTNMAAVPAIVDTLAYPISPDYVTSWTLICVCQVELLARPLSVVQVCK